MIFHVRLNTSFYVLSHVEYMVKQAEKRYNGAYKIIFPFTLDDLKKRRWCFKKRWG